MQRSDGCLRRRGRAVADESEATRQVGGSVADDLWWRWRVHRKGGRREQRHCVSADLVSIRSMQKAQGKVGKDTTEQAR